MPIAHIFYWRISFWKKINVVYLDPDDPVQNDPATSYFSVFYTNSPLWEPPKPMEIEPHKIGGKLRICVLSSPDFIVLVRHRSDEPAPEEKGRYFVVVDNNPVNKIRDCKMPKGLLRY